MAAKLDICDDRLVFLHGRRIAAVDPPRTGNKPKRSGRVLFAEHAFPLCKGSAGTTWRRRFIWARCRGQAACLEFTAMGRLHKEASREPSLYHEGDRSCPVGCRANAFGSDSFNGNMKLAGKIWSLPAQALTLDSLGSLLIGYVVGSRVTIYLSPQSRFTLGAWCRDMNPRA